MPLQNWPIVVVPVSELALDRRNVRLRVPQVEESAVLNYLYLSDRVEALAHDFLRDGYLDNELPVVVHEPDGAYTVLEGNRRVAALKGLLDPDAVPARTAQLQRLLNRYDDAEIPAEIRVMVAPSVAAAQPLLARLHTQTSKRPWPRDQQATFYYAQIQAGASTETIRKQYATSAAQITRFLKMATMLQAVRTMRIDDDALRDYVQGEDLGITSFEYVYLRAQLQLILKLEFDADGILQQKSFTDAQRKGLTFLLGLIKAGKISTRTPNLRTGAKEYLDLLDDLRRAMGLPVPPRDPEPDAPGAPADGGPSTGGGADTGTGAGSGTGTGGTAPGGTGGSGGTPPTGAGESGGKGSRGPNAPATRTRLDFDGFDYATLPHGLKQRYVELRKMDVQDLPNASFDVLRTVLECSIRVYCDAIGQPVPTGSQLGACLSHLGKQFPDKADRSTRNIINVLSAGKTEGSDEYFRSAEALNASNHDPNIFVEGGHVHWAWEHMKPLLKRMAQPVMP
jgi:hypothetical protein